jgi:hypothetical protein
MNGTIGPSYTDLETLRQYLSASDTLGTADDGLLQDCILRAEAAITAYTRRTFVGTVGTVVYSRWDRDGQVRGQALYLDRDLHTLVGVYNGDGQTIPVGSVWTEPRNDGPPYRIVRLKSSYVWTWNTDADVSVSGTFGFSTVCPADITQATLRYSAQLYRMKDVGPGDVAGFPEAGEVTYPKGMPDDVRWLLSPYRSRSGGAV